MKVGELRALLEAVPDYYDAEVQGRPVEVVETLTRVQRARDPRTGATVEGARCVVAIA